MTNASGPNFKIAGRYSHNKPDDYIQDSSGQYWSSTPTNPSVYGFGAYNLILYKEISTFDASDHYNVKWLGITTRCININ